MAWTLEERALAVFLARHPRCSCGRRATRRVEVGPPAPSDQRYVMAMCAGHAAELEDEIGA